jgi:hypothetical protein
MRLWTASLSADESMDEFALIHNANNSNILMSLLNLGKSVVGGPLRSSHSVKAQIWRRCTFDRFIGSCLFDHLERINLLARAVKIQPLGPDNMRNGICYADRRPFVIHCSQKNNGGPYPNLIPGQKPENLIFTLRFVNIAKACWHCCMFDQFHQHDHSKRTIPTVRVAKASISGLINI